jgi:hypothetical protein
MPFLSTPCLCVRAGISSFFYPIDPHLVLSFSLILIYPVCLFDFGKEFVCAPADKREMHTHTERRRGGIIN